MFRKSLSMLIVVLIALTALVPALALAESKAYVLAPTEDGAANIRSGPGMSYDVVAWGLNGDELTMIAEGNTWHKVKLVKNGRIGFIHKSYVSITGSDTTPNTSIGEAARVSTAYASSSVNLRSSAGNSGAVLASLKNGSKMVILGKSGSWYKVKHLSTGLVGYMYKDYVAKGFAGMTTGNVNVREGAGTNYDVIKVAYSGATITVLEMGKSFSKVKAGSTTGWISNRYFTTDPALGC